MSTKLTLTIENDVIKMAKVYAQQNGRSLSEIIENYLKTLVVRDKSPETISPKVKKLVGSIKLSAGFDYRQTLSQEISAKYKV